MDNGISKEAERSIAASSMFPGFRFSPTDEELILYYLKKKLDGYGKCVEVITELDICKYEPWDLPAKAVIQSDQEWFFFSPRGKKYPNGSQSKRATDIGYWKATGKERAVKSGSNVIGTKRTLVFHIGRAPKGERTEWIMHEYCVAGKGQDALVVCRLRRKCDYQTMIGTNGDIRPSDQSLLMASSGTYSGGDKEPVSTLGDDKMGEWSMKKSSSSHDSHSVEQMESAVQSEWKIKDEILQPSSTRHHAANKFEDDLFAEILKDSIVQLDECQAPPPPLPSISGAHEPSMLTSHSTNTTVPIVPRMYGANNNNQHPPRVYPSQGTANRRIRLRTLRRQSPRKAELEEGFGENVPSSSEIKHPSKSSHNIKGWMKLPKNCSRLYVVLVTIAVVIMMMVYAISPAASRCCHC